MPRPLEHLRILDLTRLLPGGFCTLLLADLGADVLKIEEPGKGDYVRWMPPMVEGVSAGHQALNRGKRSMTLNLKTPGGVEVLKRLVEEADVLIESFRPGVMERLGVGFDVLAEVNPRLVYCAITGYGQTGPYRDRAGHDVNYLGFAGVIDLVGTPDEPVIPGVQIGDLGGGALMAGVGILAALAERERTGRGRFVDISMTDGALSWLSFHAQAYLFEGERSPRGRMRLSGGMACYRLYRCKDDRWLTVGALEPQFWAALCEALGAPDLIEKHLADMDEQEHVAARIQEILMTRTRDEWVEALSDLDACVGPVKDLEEALLDPHAIAREMVVDAPIGTGGTTRAIGNPIKLVGDSSLPLRPAPGFGEDTETALKSVGYGSDEIDVLRASGAI